MRKYKSKLLIKPAKDAMKALLQKTRECIKGMHGQTVTTLIRTLNPIMQGAGYFKERTLYS